MKVEYTIELSWAHGSHNGVIELDDDYFGSLDEEERDNQIEQAVNDAVNNEVSWGWQVIPDE